jgi:AAA-like domain/TIR domain
MTSRTGEDRSKAVEPAKRARVFISYKRNSEPDEPVALQVYDALRDECDVFIDRTLRVGTDWGRRIEEELRRADFLVTFLSAQSINSEMVAAEIATAHQLCKEQNGRPAILPIRLDYSEPFRYPLSAYLDHINWALWRGGKDTPRLIEELRLVISGNEVLASRPPLKVGPATTTGPLMPPLPSAQPSRLEMPEGTMDPESNFYVQRQSDSVAVEAIKRQGVTVTIKGPRQMGKSSLLIRMIGAAASCGKRVAYLDFQLFDRSALADANVFFRQFCACLNDSLEIDDRVDEYRDEALSNSYWCTRYLSLHVLKKSGAPIVLAMDEVESIFDTAFRSDFFAMLRNWHNSRALKPAWKKLDLALVTSTEPYQLIADLNQSPFNVGLVINLEDFTPGQVAELNRRHGSPLSPGEEKRLMELINGHPYLVRRALYLVASGLISAPELFDRATEDRGPFGDHLRYHIFRMHDQKRLIEGMGQVIERKTLADENVFFRLRGAGLVRSEGRAVVPRCQLYADYFREHLNV